MCLYLTSAYNAEKITFVNVLGQRWKHGGK